MFGTKNVKGPLAACAAVLVLGAGMVAQSNPADKASPADKRFVQEAAQGGMAEVQLGQLAKDNAKSDEVKQFAQRMIDDHTKANDELKKIADAQGMQLPTEPSAKDKATMDQLKKLHGEAFDRAYMRDMVKDHTKDVAEFKHEASTGKDAQVKEFAQQTTPILESHLKQARQIDMNEKGPHSASKGAAPVNSEAGMPGSKDVQK